MFLIHLQDEFDSSMEVICIGGGAASFFFAAQASYLYPNVKISILEQGKDVLQKVKISGGGRCNVTHNCMDPMELVNAYPRGKKELLGPFYHFGPQQVIEWFKEKGVEIVSEVDGRMFPKSNKSQSIVDCLTNSCLENGVTISKGKKVVDIIPKENGDSGFQIQLLDGQLIFADKIFVGAGSSKTIWKILKRLGHTIVSPVPSLFTFKITDPRLRNLPGVAVENVDLSIEGSKLKTNGPLLITHKGLSAPSVLKMSAIAARELFERDYKFEVIIDFRPDIGEEEVKEWRVTHGKSLIINHHVLGLPKRLCASLLAHAELDPTKNFGSLNKNELDLLAKMLKRARFNVQGQNRFKEEFVTAGGVDLKEISFKDFSSKQISNMHLAGEIINIDAVTGGYNFQAAWTGAFLAAEGLMG